MYQFIQRKCFHWRVVHPPTGNLSPSPWNSFRSPNRNSGPSYKAPVPANMHLNVRWCQEIVHSRCSLGALFDGCKKLSRYKQPLDPPLQGMWIFFDTFCRWLLLQGMKYRSFVPVSPFFPLVTIHRNFSVSVQFSSIPPDGAAYPGYASRCKFFFTLCVNVFLCHYVLLCKTFHNLELSMLKWFS